MGENFSSTLLLSPIGFVPCILCFADDDLCRTGDLLDLRTPVRRIPARMPLGHYRGTSAITVSWEGFLP